MDKIKLAQSRRDSRKVEKVKYKIIKIPIIEFKDFKKVLIDDKFEFIIIFISFPAAIINYFTKPYKIIWLIFSLWFLIRIVYLLFIKIIFNLYN